MDIKTKGFSMPDGNTHIFIPPAPTETDRGGITAKTRTTEGAEVVVDPDTGKGYIGTDRTLKAKGQAADSEAVGTAISEKADRIISSAGGENVILTDSAEATLQGLKVFGRSMQDGVPSPDAPVPIESVGDKGDIGISIDGNPQQKLRIETPNGLPGIKVDSGGNYTDSTGQQWICDRIVEKDGVIGIERHIAKKVLTGLEWWSVDERQNENNGVFFTGMPESGKDNERVLCNRFKWKHTTDIYGTIDTKYHQFRFFAENRTITVDEWKRFVANNNIEVYYQLQKPTFEPLPQSEQDAYEALHTNNPTTVISNDESAHMEVTYAADTKNYILNREKAMQKQISDIQAALISQKISGGGYKNN